MEAKRLSVTLASQLVSKSGWGGKLRPSCTYLTFDSRHQEVLSVPSADSGDGGLGDEGKGEPTRH